jgi:hypothetical protein
MSMEDKLRYGCRVHYQQLFRAPLRLSRPSASAGNEPVRGTSRLVWDLQYLCYVHWYPEHAYGVLTPGVGRPGSLWGSRGDPGWTDEPRRAARDRDNRSGTLVYQWGSLHHQRHPNYLGEVHHHLKAGPSGRFEEPRSWSSRSRRIWDALSDISLAHIIGF